MERGGGVKKFEIRYRKVVENCIWKEKLRKMEHRAEKLKAKLEK